jgi:hypothetical protein
MLFRLLFLIALLGTIGGDARTPDADGVHERRMGGEGFGNIVMLFVVVGGLVLLGIIAVAMLALTGQFDNEMVDPAV